MGIALTPGDVISFVSTGATVSVDWHTTQVDKLIAETSPSSVKTVPASGNIAAAATTQVSTTVAALHEAMVKTLSAINVHGSAIITGKFVITPSGGAARALTPAVSMAPGDKLQYDASKGWGKYDSNLGIYTAVSTPTTRVVLTAGTAATYTTPAGCRAIEIEIWAGGGGGAGSATAATSASAGSGGAAGGYCRDLISPPAASYVYTVGVKGAGGVSGANGGAGTDTTFGGLTAKGGGGGIFQAAANTALLTVGGARGAISTGGDINGSGEPGEGSNRASATIAKSGSGGSTALGGAGGDRVTQGAGDNAIANTGSGGGGALTLNGGVVQTGGNGADGLIVVTEYY